MSSIHGDSALPRTLSKSYEWYTPKKYIDAARSVMNGIDLDPASCLRANETVQAAAYYDLSTDGFNRPWHGRVWCNPPYGRVGLKSSQELWSCRLIEQYELGTIEQAILLVTARVEAKWFQRMWQYPVCLTNHRINFERVEGKGGGSTIGSAFVYFGPEVARFITVFSRFGPVVRCVSVLQPSLWEKEGATW